MTTTTDKRTILAHINIEVAGDDPRTADHIAADLESAVHVGLEGAPDDNQLGLVVFTLVEEL